MSVAVIELTTVRAFFLIAWEVSIARLTPTMTMSSFLAGFESAAVSDEV